MLSPVLILWNSMLPCNGMNLAVGKQADLAGRR